MTVKYYRTVIEFEVLSTEPLGPVSLRDLDYQTMEGHMSGTFLDTTEEVVTKERMIELLTAQGTDPEFLIEDEEQ